MGSVYSEDSLATNSSQEIMKSLVFTLVLSLATGSPVLLDTPEVAAEKANFALAFKAAEMGEHAKLAPVNLDVQEPAPVFSGAQIPESFLADLAPVAEARAAFTAAFDTAAAGGLATKQVPAPQFSGIQVPTAYLADTMEVADAKTTFMAAFDDAAAGGLAAMQAPAPAVPEPVAAVKSAAVVPAVVAPAVATPVLYAHHYPYTYHTGLTYSGLPTVPYTSLPYHSFQPLTYTHTLPYAGFLPFPQLKPAAVAESVEEPSAVETE